MVNISKPFDFQRLRFDEIQTKARSCQETLEEL
jgi:hypothetical protein